MLRRPSYAIALWFGCGLLPWAPGTWGSLAALPLAGLLYWVGGAPAIVIGAVLVFCAGLWASAAYCRTTGRKDPSEVVVDEVAAQLLVLSVLPLTWWAYALGFVTFRIADIAKPWPVSWLDREVGGGLGVMLDDVGAALYAIVVSLVVVSFIPE